MVQYCTDCTVLLYCITEQTACSAISWGIAAHPFASHGIPWHRIPCGQQRCCLLGGDDRQEIGRSGGSCRIIIMQQDGVVLWAPVPGCLRIRPFITFHFNPFHFFSSPPGRAKPRICKGDDDHGVLSASTPARDVAGARARVREERVSQGEQAGPRLTNTSSRK